MKPGIYTMSPEAYHADPCERPSLSAGIAHTLYSRSPRHAWYEHPKLNPAHQPDEASKYDIGTATHALLLEPDRKVVHEVEADSWRTNAAKEVRDAARASGLVPLLSKDLVRVREMVDAIREQLAARDDDPPLFSVGAAEQTLIWEEPPGVLCRVRPDWLRADFTAVDDLKTAGRTANPRDWCRKLLWEKPHLQACLYARGVKALTGIEPAWRFVVVESEPPYALSVIDLAPSARDLSERRLDFVLAEWKRCLDENDWPGYSRRIYSAEVTAFGETEFLDRIDVSEEIAA